MSTTGEIDRCATSPLFLARTALGKPFAASRTALEQRVAAIRAELPGPDSVSVNDGFFDLGGDSLPAMTEAQQVEQHLGISTPPGMLS